jgi:hypothetical protein
MRLLSSERILCPIQRINDEKGDRVTKEQMRELSDEWARRAGFESAKELEGAFLVFLAGMKAAMSAVETIEKKETA